jgi:hypothetical protein
VKSFAYAVATSCSLTCHRRSAAAASWAARDVGASYAPKWCIADGTPVDETVVDEVA